MSIRVYCATKKKKKKKKEKENEKKSVFSKNKTFPKKEKSN